MPLCVPLNILVKTFSLVKLLKPTLYLFMLSGIITGKALISIGSTFAKASYSKKVAVNKHN